MNADFVQSGVSAVDVRFGGLPAHGITLVRGGRQTGKTLFAASAALAALHRNERTCFLTSGAPERLLEEVLVEVGRDLSPYLRARDLVLLAYGPSFDSKLRSLADPRPALTELAAVFRQRGVRTVIIDGLGPFLETVEIGQAKPFAEGLVEELRRLADMCVCTIGEVGAGAPAMAAQAVSLAVDMHLDIVAEHDGLVLSARRSPHPKWNGEPVPISRARGEGLVARVRPAAPAAPAVVVAAPVVAAPAATAAVATTAVAATAVAAAAATTAPAVNLPAMLELRDLTRGPADPRGAAQDVPVPVAKL
jgi:archaellum biogenesis ATPase FlaH